VIRSRPVICFAFAIALLGAGCRRGPINTAPAEAPLKSGPLTDFVPAAGLRWMAAARLADLENTPSLRPLLAQLVPDARLDAFTLSTGIDLRQVPDAVAAGFDYSTLYFAETPFENSPIETRFVDRLVSGATVESTHPRVRRVSGTIGLVAETLVRVDHRFVVFDVGDPGQAKIVELFVTGRIARSPSALRGSALGAVPADLASAPARFYAAGPFTGEWEKGARGLLGAATAVGVTATPEGQDLHVRLVIVGNYAGMDVARLSSAWQDLAESSIGRLTSLDQPSVPPEVRLEAGYLALDVKILARPLFAGMRAAVAADVWEMLGAPSRRSGDKPPGNNHEH